MHLTKENLNLHRIASKEEARYALTGIYVDPSARATAASDGKMLAVVTIPGEAPQKGAKPFILPAKIAQQLAKDLGDGAKLQVGFDKDKPTLTLVNGKKSNVVPFEPIDGNYPDYQRAELFSGSKKAVVYSTETAYLQDVVRAACIGKTVKVALFGRRIQFESEARHVTMQLSAGGGEDEGRILTFDSDLLKQMLSVAAIGPSVTLSMYEDRLRVEAKSDEQSAKAVLMCCGQPTSAPSAQAPADEAAKPSVEPAVPKIEKAVAKPQPAPSKVKPSKPAVVEDAPASASNRPRRWGRYRKPYVPKEGDVNKPPTERQRMLYTFFLRRHEEEITPEILASTDFVGKIEELKQELSFDPDFATWNQWLKVNYLLLDQKADPERVCEVLNGITDKKSASEAISSLPGTPVPAAA